MTGRIRAHASCGCVGKSTGAFSTGAGVGVESSPSSDSGSGASRPVRNFFSSLGGGSEWPRL